MKYEIVTDQLDWLWPKGSIVIKEENCYYVDGLYSIPEQLFNSLKMNHPGWIKQYSPTTVKDLMTQLSKINQDAIIKIHKDNEYDDFYVSFYGDNAKNTDKVIFLTTKNKVEINE